MSELPVALPEILVVDDERAIRDLLARYLGGRGFAVTTAQDGPTMRAKLREGSAAAILLDVNMPGESGLDLLDGLRAGGDRRPVILLTSRHELADRVTGIQTGADDYVVKPFEPREVLARLRAVLRRCPISAERRSRASMASVRLGRCRYDPAVRQLTDVATGAEVLLTVGEAEILTILLRHPSTTVVRARLAEEIGADPRGRGVDAHILRLRRKLEPDPARPCVIITKPGVGYALEPGMGRSCSFGPT